MRIKLDKKCAICRTHLDFVEKKDGVYVLCGRCRMSVYMPAEAAAEYADDFPTLVELMTTELADTAKTTIKKRRIRWRFD